MNNDWNTPENDTREVRPGGFVREPGQPRRRSWSRGLTFPLLILFIGIVYLLDQMNVVSANHIFHYFWGAFFLLMGLEGIALKKGPGRFWGWCFALVGGALLLNSFGIIHASWGIVWPLLVIFWGIWLLLRAMGVPMCGSCDGWGRSMRKDWKERAGQESADSRSDISVIFSSLKKRISTPNFQGGKMSAIFGEGDIDLSDANIQGDEAVIEAEAVFGAHKIRVPRGWDVQARGTAIFGEFVDRTNHQPLPGIPAKRLILLGHAVFGSVVVRD